LDLLTDSMIGGEITAEKGAEVLVVATREVAKFVREFAAWQPLHPN
jgi:hypothetical protein